MFSSMCHDLTFNAKLAGSICMMDAWPLHGRTFASVSVGHMVCQQLQAIVEKSRTVCHRVCNQPVCFQNRSNEPDEEEDLASVLAEGLAKVLFHARAWSSSTSKGLQVSALTLTIFPASVSTSYSSSDAHFLPLFVAGLLRGRNSG